MWVDSCLLVWELLVGVWVLLAEELLVAAMGGSDACFSQLQFGEHTILEDLYFLLQMRP